MTDVGSDVSAIELRVRTAEDLQGWWLDGFPDGGLFVPGTIALPAGSRVVLRISTEHPSAGSTVLMGTVAWRRLSAGAVLAANRPPAAESGPVLRPGLGIAFDPAMRSRLLFLDRVGRGAAQDGRAGLRYPAALVGELAVRGGERAISVAVDDVGPRGVRIRLAGDGFVRAGTPIRLWLAEGTSGASSFAALAGHVAWVGRGTEGPLGIRLELGSKEDRLHWARVFHRCRAEFERRFVAEARLVG
jgi:hypothetical protein